MRRLLAVLGRDVSRSLSPELHRAAADACGIDVAYVPISCATEERFHRAIQSLVELDALGANVTIPYKASALAMASHSSDVARAIGAANTLSFPSMEADNTDGPGLLAVLQRLPDARLDDVVILGAGGAARAAAWAVRSRGAKGVRVAARSGAEACAEIAGGRGTTLARCEGATLVISSLPGDPDLADRALREWIDPTPRPFVLDLAYGGSMTESALVRLAKSAGLEAEDGLSMLIEQAGRSLAIWSGHPLAPILRAMTAWRSARTRTGLTEEP
jgi:shikimate dehydrogenase